MFEIENVITLSEGQKFTALDKLGRLYTYSFTERREEETYGIVLFNHDLNCETCVEEEWFRQRTLSVIG